MTYIQKEINQDNYQTWSNVFQKFKLHANQNGNIEVSDFANILGLSSFYAQKILRKISFSNDLTVVNFQEYMVLVKIFLDQDPQPKRDFLFQCLCDNNTQILKQDLNTLVNESLNTKRSSITSNEIVDLIYLNKEFLTQEEFEQLLKIDNLEEACFDSFLKRLLKVEKKNLKKIGKAKFLEKRSKITLFIFIVFKLISYLVVFINVYQEWNLVSLALAKSAGFSLKINSTLIYLPMLQFIKTTFREMKFGKVKLKSIIAFDQSINYHMFLGYWTFFDVLVHFFGHLVNNWSALFNLYSSLVGISGAGLTGLFIIITTLAHFRHKWYNLFIFGHYLTYLWLPLSVVHVPNQYQWYIPIILLIIFDKMMLHWYYQNSLMTIEDTTTIVSQNICNLSVLRGHAKIKVGGYYLICIPSINSIEWHPFSIASSPCDKKQISFMIRKVGDWTGKLYHHIKHTRESFQVKLIGPFCSPAIEAVYCKKLLLIATGIGITPHISIIKHFYEKKKNSCLVCPDCNKLVDSKLNLGIKLVWSLRDIGCLHFIFNLLSEIEKQQEIWAEKIFHFEIYITGNGQKGDIDTLWTQIAITKKFIYLNKFGKLYFSRPNMNQLIENTDPDTNVFFCGSHTLGDKLRYLCQNRKISYSQEMFD